MFEKIISIGMFLILVELIHYRNTYWKSKWDKITKEMR